MKNLIYTFFETSKDRLKNPLIGTFLFAWIAVNWKPLSVLILSPDTIYFRIDIIEQCYSSVWLNIFLPLLITMFYLLALPYIMWFFDLLINVAIKKRKQNMINLKLSELDGKIELANKEYEIEEIKSNYLDKAELNKKIKELEKVITQKDLTLNDLDTEILNLKKGTIIDNKSEASVKEDRVEKIVNYIINKKYDDSFEEIIDYINNLEYIELSGFKNVLNYLLRVGAIEIDKNVSNDNISKKYLFTDFGKIIKNKFIDNRMNK